MSILRHFFARNIQSLKGDRTLEEIAQKSGVSLRNLKRYIADPPGNATLDSVEGIARALGVEPSNLLKNPKKDTSSK